MPDPSQPASDQNEPSPPVAAKPRWRPLSSIDRRIVGVLAEKAKTTPDVYPMTVNGICTGSNQKSNRAPLMNLEPDDVEESLERLREVGAVGMIEGYGRVPKYRHYLYEWRGVDKVEMAVMTELLLRGAQTEGELRGRAARMEPIADLGALRPILVSLKAKGLIFSLTSEGRGHVLTHALYPPEELARRRAQFGPSRPAAPPTAAAPVRADYSAQQPYPPTTAPSAVPPPPAAAPGAGGAPDLIEVIRRDLVQLRAELQQLRSDMDDLIGRQDRTDQDVRNLKDALGG